MIKRVLRNMAEQRVADRRAALMRNLMRREAKIGGQLFGDIKPGGRREFFCLDEYTWVWHEEWIDKSGRRQICTTRYDVRPNGIVKSQNGQYSAVDKQEAQRLIEAAKVYQQRVKHEVYAFAL